MLFLRTRRDSGCFCFGREAAKKKKEAGYHSRAFFGGEDDEKRQDSRVFLCEGREGLKRGGNPMFPFGGRRDVKEAERARRGERMGQPPCFRFLLVSYLVFVSFFFFLRTHVVARACLER